MCAQRGAEWLQSQLDWKLAFPYAQRRKLSGLAGLVALYQDYRRLTDQLFAALDVDKVAIDTSAGDWPAYDQAMRRALGVADSPAPDPAPAS